MPPGSHLRSAPEKEEKKEDIELGFNVPFLLIKAIIIIFYLKNYFWCLNKINHKDITT